jgi:hypothetical protein
VNLNGPFLKTSFSTTASIDISSPKRLEISFLEGRIATPQLLQDVEFPDSIYVLGQYVDLTNLKVPLFPHCPNAAMIVSLAVCHNLYDCHPFADRQMVCVNINFLD